MKGGFINLYPIYDLTNNPIIHPKYLELNKKYIINFNKSIIDYNTFSILDYNKENIITLMKTLEMNESISNYIRDYSNKKFNFVLELFKLYNSIEGDNKIILNNIINQVLDIKQLNNYNAPILITKDFGIFNDFEITNFIICIKTN